MARKRLSDLLREEAQKTPDPAVSDPASDGTPEAPIKPSSARNGGKTSTRATSSRTPSSPAVEPKPDPATEKLQANLEAAEIRESALKQQVTDLKAELKTQTAVAKKLQTALDKAEQHNEQLGDKLTDATQAAIHLAETNSQLQQALDELKQSAEQPPAPKLVAQPAPIAKAEPIARPGFLSQQDLIRRRQAESLAHPVFPNGKSATQSTEPDLGWFD